MTRRAAFVSLALATLAVAALACTLPGAAQLDAPTLTAQANRDATSTVDAAATTTAQLNAIALTQTALVPTATLTPSATLTLAPSATGGAANPASVSGTATQTSIANGTLKVGVEAFVRTTKNGVLNMRDKAGKAGTQLAQIPGDSRVRITDGPQAADGLLWWKVQILTSASASLVGKMGWCAESDGTVQTLEAAK